MSVNKIHEFFNHEPENWDILTFLEECNIPLFKQKIESYLTSLEVISNTQKGPKRERADKLLNLYRQGSDYVRARDWKKEKKAKPVDGTSVHIHQVTADNSMIGINSGSFDINNMPKRNKEDEKIDHKQKRTKIEHYFPHEPHETQRKQQLFENVDNDDDLSGITLVPSDDILDQLDGYTTPSPRSPMTKNLTVELPRVKHQNKILVDMENNPFLEESDFILSIDDIPCDLTFEDGNSADDFYIEEINVSSLF
ncbi:hypothetical protein RclHR1_01220050 [Rhizophagus clarus]|uniref:Uncharacterized protein n=1 Tax=Rhizophagus clarus TaxID=94130 RepID=A0A2Z6QLN2_9GLOM|nr:hypothetical protein RclHR1_01220050 [Rhizophagus clarus]